MKFIRSKLLLILCAIIFLLFVTNDFGLVNIERTAIIMAIGIDYDKETDEYDVTTQIAIPQPSTTASPENNDSLISEKGKTIAATIDKIGINTGWYPMLSFCNLIILGESLMDFNVMETINYFIRTDKIQDSAFIATCEGKAKDVLSSSTPLDSVSSFTIQKILGKDIAKLDRIANISIKDFTQRYYSKSKSGFMPLIKKIKIEQSAKGSSGSGDSSGSSGSSGGSSDKQGKDQFVFDASNTVIFKDGVKVETLTSEETLFFNIEYKNSLDTFLSLDNVDIDGKKTEVMLGINEYKKKYKLKKEKDGFYFCIDLVFFCKYEDANIQTEITKLNPTATIPNCVLKTAESKIESSLLSLFSKLQKSDCDIFQITDDCYKFFNKDYERLKSDFFKSVKIRTSVDCQTEKSTRL